MLIEIILKILRIPFVQIYLRCVYTTMKNIFQNHDSFKSKLQFTHNCFAFLGATRFLVYFFYPNETSFIAKHDPMAVFVFKHSNLSTFLIATALFFGFFVLRRSEDRLRVMYLYRGGMQTGANRDERGNRKKPLKSQRKPVFSVVNAPNEPEMHRGREERQDHAGDQLERDRRNEETSRGGRLPTGRDGGGHGLLCGRGTTLRHLAGARARGRAQLRCL